MEQCNKIIEILKENNLSISGAESITGGLVSSELVKVSGASDVFRGTLVSYQSSVKINTLKVASELIDKYTPVSIAVLSAMLDGAKALFKTDIVYAITGSAGPTSYDGIPVGLVYYGLSYKNHQYLHKKIYSGSRCDIIEEAKKDLIDLILEIISK